MRAAELTLRVVPEGLKLLEREDTRQPSYFDDRALRAVRELALLRVNELKGLGYLRVRSTGKPCNVGQQSAKSVERLLNNTKSALGSIEGYLQTITARNGLQFVVYDSLYDKGVNCRMDDKMIQEAIKAFRKRVSVSGWVQYGQDGRPLTIDVDEIRVFKDESKLPHHRRLRGIFKTAK